MKMIGKTDIGRSRPENQDTFRSGSLPGVAAWGVVCDGMGGAQNGRLASAVAAECIEEQLYRQISLCGEDAEVERLLCDSVRLANAEVFARSGEGEQLMGTTAVCAVIRNGRLHIAHVGDSRAYLFSKGHLLQLTRDHSVVQELVDQGALTSDEASRHPEKNVITRALGVEEDVEISYAERPIEREETLLLCTDGLTNMVPVSQIAILMQENDFFDQPRMLVTEALEAGGSDNITVLLMKQGEEDMANG